MEKTPYWNTVVNALHDSLIVVDPKGQIMAVNSAFEKLTGYLTEEMIGQSCRMFNCTGCRIIGAGSGPKWCGLFADGRVSAKRCTITDKDGKTIEVIKNASILYRDNNEIIGAVEVVRDMSEVNRQQNEINKLRRSMHLNSDYHSMIGRSPVMQILYEMVENVALTEAPVLISGESGTGKELVAQAIHGVSDRRDKPYIKVNCASLNENLLESELFGHAKGSYTGANYSRVGRFEAAHEGTIFLDEIGDIPLDMQVKLLRVLEEKEIERVGEQTPIKVDVRIISATNKNLEELIAKGFFREDLYYRINVFPLKCPALRERREDIPAIVQWFIRQNAAKTGKKITGLTLEAMEIMARYTWPGNVREMRNAVEYAFVLCPCGSIDVNHLPPTITKMAAEPAFSADTQDRDSSSKETLLRVLRQANGNQSEAGRILGVSRVAIWKRIKKYGIDVKREILV